MVRGGDRNQCFGDEDDYAERGKYHQRLSKKRARVVILEPDVAKAFPDSAAVNDALRALLQIARSSRRPAARSSQTTRKGVAAWRQRRTETHPGQAVKTRAKANAYCLRSGAMT
jgi:hypothetical protein